MVNSTIGGKGVRGPLTEDAKMRIAEANRKRQTGRKMPPGFVEKRLLTFKKRGKNPGNFKKGMVAWNKGIKLGPSWNSGLKLGPRLTPMSQEARDKISRAKKGKPSPLKGRIRPEEVGKRISEAKKAKNFKHSEETKRIISEKNKGGKGFVGKHSEESKIKISMSLKGKPAWNKGIPMSEERKRKLDRTGIKRTMESRTRQSEALKNTWAKKKSAINSSSQSLDLAS